MPDTPRHYRFEGYCLDTQTRELRDGGGAVVALTAKAFDTLCFLIENRNRLVGKEALFDAVWPGRVVEDNNLTQAIATLPRAFGTDGSDHRFIVTVPGRGYRFVAGIEGNGAEVDGGNVARLASIWRQPITVGALLFMLALFGTAATCVALVVASVARLGQRDAVPVLVGSGLYLIGVILVTIVCNVPRNDMLAGIDPASQTSAPVWAGYVNGWTLWNHVRTISALTATAAFIIALR